MTGEKSKDLQLGQLRSRIATLEKRQKKVESLAERAKSIVSTIDEHKVMRLLDSIDGRVSELSNRLQAEILKLSVCSEVSRVYPGIWKKIVRALDAEDNWWMAGKNLTIDGWKHRIGSLEDAEMTNRINGLCMNRAS